MLEKVSRVQFRVKTIQEMICERLASLIIWKKYSLHATIAAIAGWQNCKNQNENI